MKPLIPILSLFLIIIAFITGMWYGRMKPVMRNQPLRLEQILSIKELHLVRHVYQDLFFLHKKNDESKSIRAIVQIPVEITAYLNLKEIEVKYIRDSIKQIILPRAHLNAPYYKVDRMVIRKTHRFQIHAGKDLYPEVGIYLSEILQERIDTVRNLAVANLILVQAETEGKAYIESMLMAAGRSDIKVMFGDEAIDRTTIQFHSDEQRETMVSSHVHASRQVEETSFGFIPPPRKQ